MRKKRGVLDLEVADVEVGGDIHRIILSGIRNPAETGALDTREKIFREYDELRRLLISYPYGHEDMCADFVFETSHAEAAHGYVIMESMGYPYFSGSNTIATVAALLEYNRIPITEGSSQITLESPGGIITAWYRVHDDIIEEVTVKGGSAYVINDYNKVDVPGLGTVEYALVWSGAYFIMVDAAALGLQLDNDHLLQMKKAGFAVTEAIAETFTFRHPQFGSIEPPGFVHFMGACEKTGEKYYKGNGATYGHPDTVYYCPTGTGTSARMALMVHRRQMEDDVLYKNVSAAGNAFTGRALGRIKAGDYDALDTTITAKPFVLATTKMHIDFTNPLMKDYEKIREIMG